MTRDVLDFEPERYVFERGHVRPERVALEHEVQVALAGRFKEGFFRVDHHVAVYKHHAVLGFFQSGNHAQRGGFAAAGGTEQGHKCPVFNREVDIAQNVIRAVKLIDML
ncbi:hypothetical protein SDC9_88526 [bioreactor metagenome]|uniref:Uncharacterized protein n=1 Tax=bioreactor metagenome TaxID=1076179 RepID=A0A644ZM65_9ZZZZ